MKHGIKTAALIVIVVMGLVALSSIWMVYDLIRQIPTLPAKIDKDVVIVFVAQIGSLTTFGGTAIGILGGVLGSTEKQQPPPATPPTDQEPQLGN